jgi:hypothetical protein
MGARTIARVTSAALLSAAGCVAGCVAGCGRIGYLTIVRDGGPCGRA